MYPKNSIKLFECCIPVKGPTKSIICDLQRNIYDVIPNTLYDFLIQYDGNTIAEIKKDFIDLDYETIDEYIDFLLENEYIFFTNSPSLFPKLNLEFKTPFEITNSIIDVDTQSNHNFKDIFEQLSYFKCQAVEIRFFDFFTIENIREILNETKNTTFRSISLLIKYDDTVSVSDLEKLFDMGIVLNNILLHSCTTGTLKSSEKIPIFLTDKKINDESHCGIINHYNFNVNIGLFTESVNYNNCLNRKISVDKTGLIKNCPSCQKSYGHISTTKIFDVLNLPEFKEVWSVKKDKIEDCKVCEFRYICVDCRAYTKNEGDMYSKPLKCSYNPYTGTNENITHE
jgi:SPASM domain peptide maturase of grasp-with-spasm system